MAAVLLHLATVLLTKAYRRPRELTWITGIVLLFLTLALGFSGYLLPWNQRSYFATLVGTQVPGCLPVVGPIGVELLRGGQQVSGDTITRFYAAHVVLVPIVLTAVLVFHVGLVQFHGMSLPLAKRAVKVRDHEPFFVEFLLTDASIWLVLLGVLATLAVCAGGRRAQGRLAAAGAARDQTGVVFPVRVPTAEVHARTPGGPGNHGGRRPAVRDSLS